MPATSTFTRQTVVTRLFAELLRRDGHRVESNGAAFGAEALEGVDVLVIANAMHEQSKDDWAPLPNHSAFTDAEIEIVERCVRGGGFSVGFLRGPGSRA